MEKRQRLSPRAAAVLWRRIDDAMQRRHPAIVGPALHQIADVDDEGAGNRRHGDPCALARGDLQAFHGGPGCDRSLYFPEGVLHEEVFQHVGAL